MFFIFPLSFSLSISLPLSLSFSLCVCVSLVILWRNSLAFYGARFFHCKLEIVQLKQLPGEIKLNATIIKWVRTFDKHSVKGTHALAQRKWLVSHRIPIVEINSFCLTILLRPYCEPGFISILVMTWAFNVRIKSKW